MTACGKWKDRLLDSALGAPLASEVEEHLKSCATCSAALVELRARRERMDVALQGLARGAKPSPVFRARLLASLEAHAALASLWPARARVLTAVALVVVMGLFLVPISKRRRSLTQPGAVSISESALSRWRSPTDGLLHSSADEFLESSPRLGEVYFPLNSGPPRPATERRWRKL